jgi:nucleoid-associated protein YgaU
MQRYSYNKHLKNLDTHENNLHHGEPGLTTTILPKITRDFRDTVIVAKSTDRLDLIAHRFYSDRTLWWVIALANNLPGDSLFIEPGIQIFIPKNINPVLNDLQIKNTIE